MPLVTTKEMFAKAYDGGYAIGAFNVNNMEIVQGITEAAGELKSPVILQVSKGARSYANHTYLVKLVDPSADLRLQFLIIGIFGALISMIGDLAASAIKRNNEVKDYGKLIPGHGGVLDRFDSMIFTAPILYYLVLFVVG